VPPELVPTADPELLRAGARGWSNSSCNPRIDAIIYGTIADPVISQRLQTLFASDQAARATEPIDWDTLHTADLDRRVEVLDYLQKGQVVTAEDLYHAAMIFQHGNCGNHFKLANELARRAVEQGHEGAKWLYAAALDRYLQSEGKLQKFGTQYYNFRNRWELYPVDPTTTDEERQRYNVDPLVRILDRVDALNNE
jgi:hypothetical protein